MKQNKTRIPTQDRSKDTKRQIIQAGLKLFSEKGYYKTNSKEIAKEAGVSTGSFYAYFSDKEELFKEVFIEHHERIKSVVLSVNVNEFVNSGNIRKYFRHMTEKLIEAHTISPGFHQEVKIMLLSNKEIQVVMKGIRDGHFKMMKDHLSAWKNQLQIKDLEAAAVLVLMVLEETVHSIKFSEKKRVSDKRLINEMVDMLYKYIVKMGG